MFLAIDVGNSHTAIALMESNKNIVAHWRTVTNKINTPDELAIRLRSFLQLDNIELSSIDACAISSVVPTLTISWEAATRHLGIDAQVLHPIKHATVVVDAPHPEEMGVDRLANVAEAIDKYGAPVIVVDFGTATNFDIINRDKVFAGGIIAPGVMLSAQALFSEAALLANVPIKDPGHVLANTTETCVQAGIVCGAAAMCDGLIARIKQEMGVGSECKVIATGGIAKVVSTACKSVDVVDGDLTLRGIYQIYKEKIQK